MHNVDRHGEWEVSGADRLLPPLRRLVASIEGAAVLDGVASTAKAVGGVLVGSRGGGLLLGRPVGHAAHPFLTDIPMGAWMSAVLLDVTRPAGSSAAARRLVGFGVAAAVPTVLTGLAELAAAGNRAGRVGVVHASSNLVALTFFAASYRARRHGHHVRGAVSALVGLGAASVGGYLGAHLAIARGVGSRDDEYVELGGSESSRGLSGTLSASNTFSLRA